MTIMNQIATQIKPSRKADPADTFWTHFEAAVFAADEADGFPPRAWETAVALYLFDRGYTVAEARGILDHAAAVGSVECGSVVRECDRRAVERLLPVAPPSAWARFDGDVWATTAREEG